MAAGVWSLHEMIQCHKSNAYGPFKDEKTMGNLFIFPTVSPRRHAFDQPESPDTKDKTRQWMLPSVVPIMNGGGVLGVPPMSTRSQGVAMEGKSLFTCSQCGSLLKFRSNVSPIKDRIALLREIPIEASDAVSTVDGAGIQQPAVISELVWENQQRVVRPSANTEDAEAEAEEGKDQYEWIHVAFNPVSSVAPFVSANRGGLGMTLEETIPNRLLSKPHLWLSETWDVDTSFPECDAEGWIYCSKPLDPMNPEDGLLPLELGEEEEKPPQDATMRRRRYARKRQTDGSDLSWFQELLDCSALLLEKKTPSCHDCELSIIQNLQYTLNGLESDRQQYQAFLSDFSVEEPNDHGEDWGIDAEIQALEQEERRLQAELSTLEVDSIHVLSRRRDLWSTGTDLEQLIRGTFTEGAFLQHLLGLSRDERQSVGVFSVHASDMLRRLQRYNVCNDVFHIWHDGLFGTINGLRLGRLPTRPVEWVEINAALGQAVLLLATIAERANFEFTRNKLVPRGSYSRVVNMYGKEYSLHSDGGMFRRRGFNQAMVLFLECVDDAGKRAMREEPSLKFPYKIQRGKIGDLPISLGNDEQWTKALKYMLTHLKWLLAWVAKKYP